MKRSRKPHITARRNFLGGWDWFAKNRGRTKTSYFGRTPDEALRRLNEHRYHPIIEQGRFR